MSSLVEKIEKLIAPTVESMGFNLVQVKLIDGRQRLLQIMAERPDGSMSLDDCTAISHQLSAILDVEDVLPDAYRLEISSPGIDRPLVKEQDYRDYVGHLAKVELSLPVNGRRRFTGTLKGLESGAVTLVVDNEDVTVNTQDIQSAKLVLTDALIKAFETRRQTS